MQEEAVLTGRLGLLAQGGEPAQDAGGRCTGRAPDSPTGRSAWGAVEVGVAVAEVGKLNRNTHFHPP